MKTLFVLSLILFITTVSFAQSKLIDQSIGITISLPEYNSCRYYDYNYGGNNKATGIFGIGGALFYKKGLNKLSLNGAFTTFFNPDKANLMGGRNSYPDLKFIEATVNHKLYGIIHGIAGINYSDYILGVSNYMDEPIPGYHYFAYTKEDKTIGLTTGAELAFTKTCALAFFYRPSLYCFQLKSYRYMLSVDARFDIGFWNKKVAK